MAIFAGQVEQTVKIMLWARIIFLCIMLGVELSSCSCFGEGKNTEKLTMKNIFCGNLNIERDLFMCLKFNSLYNKFFFFIELALEYFH